MKKILILGTGAMSVYQHRLELIRTLIDKGVEVHVAATPGSEVSRIREAGCIFTPLSIENRGTNPFKDLVLLRAIVKLIRKIHPDVVLTFYTKTNIYGGIACQITRTPYITNITGMGTALAAKGKSQQLMSRLYKLAIRSAHEVFFQNKPNYRFFHENHLWDKESVILPGSGVALERFPVIPFPQDKTVRFAFIGRVLKQKGIFEYIGAAEILRKKYDNVEFHVVGPVDEECLAELKEYANDGLIIDHGKVIDTQQYIKDIDCMVFPSYYPEGMANVILESASSGRPVITTNVTGCGEAVDDNITGFVVRAKDVDDLTQKMERIINMSKTDRAIMGLNGRKKMEQEFDRSIVVNEYLRSISELIPL